MKKAELTSASRSRSICVVACTLNEEKYLDEWLVYHKMLGISHFYLYDEGPALSLKPFLEPHKAYVSTFSLQKKNGLSQTNKAVAYRHAFENFLHEHEWVIFLDVQDFVVLREHNTIADFLNEFDQAAVILNCHAFGHNGYYDDPGNLITSSLIRRKLQPINSVRTFTRIKYISKIRSINYCELREGAGVDANKRKYQKKIYKGKTAIAHVNKYEAYSFKSWMKCREPHISDVLINPPSILPAESLLMQFVKTIAFNHNEYIDEYLVKFGYPINKNILSLNRGKNFFTLVSPLNDDGLIEDINKILSDISKNVLIKIETVDSIGLHGKTGLVVYLLSYARFSKNQKLEETGVSFMEEIAEKISSETSIAFKNGLTGFGAALECLVQNGLIEADTDTMFEDVDQFLLHKIRSQSVDSTTALNTRSGIGKYFLSRFQNPFRSPLHHFLHQKKTILSLILNISLSYHYNYTDLIDSTHLMSRLYHYSDEENRIKIISRFVYIKDKMNNELREGKHDDLLQINPLETATLLFFISKLLNDNSYQSLAKCLLEEFEKNHIDRALTGNRNDAALNLWLGYYHLFLATELEEHYKSALYWLERSVFFLRPGLSLNAISDNPEDQANIAQQGLYLLYALDPRVKDCIKLYEYL